MVLQISQNLAGFEQRVVNLMRWNLLVKIMCFRKSNIHHNFKGIIRNVPDILDVATPFKTFDTPDGFCWAAGDVVPDDVVPAVEGSKIMPECCLLLASFVAGVALFNISICFVDGIEFFLTLVVT